MEYTHLGRSGVSVSRLCLGTMNFGEVTDEVQGHKIMDHALDQGINFFDTSSTYGEPRAEGITEQIIGRWLASGSGRRDRIVLATKVYGGKGEWPNDSYLSARHIRQACEDSLRWLGTDHLDLYQMHHIDRSTPWEEIWEAMDILRAQGKIIYTGSSNFAGWHIAQAQEAARHRQSLGLVSEQSLYNLATRAVELEVIPACKAYGVGLISWSPLHGGLLGGVIRKERSVRGSTGRAAQALAGRRPQVEEFEAFCGELGETPASVATSWLLRQPAISSVIVGPRIVEHLEDALRALELDLDEAVLGRLDDIFPGPGGPAPEAYAW